MAMQSTSNSTRRVRLHASSLATAWTPYVVKTLRPKMRNAAKVASM